MEIKSITELGAGELKGKTVLVRVDFNVQVYEGKILDDLRIRKTIPTISYLRNAGARIILISHIESKDGTGLAPVAEYINQKYQNEYGTVQFIQDFLSDSSYTLCKELKEGEVILFENLRVNAGEKENDPDFAKALAKFADIYVNDAFAVSHRAHASVVGVPALFPIARFAGIQLMKEVENLKTAFNPPHPFIFILGGAKFETKLPLIEKFSKHADKVYLGGALLNDVLKAKGFPVGQSLVSSGEFNLDTVVSNPKLVIPTDVTVEGIDVVEGSDGINVAPRKIVETSNVSADDVIMDVGPSLNAALAKDLLTAQFVLWNGPMGNYEKGYKEQTIEMAKLVYRSKVKTILGGGDTTATIAELGYEADTENSQIFVSTGGGAMLEFLENESLPGIEALK